MTSRVLYVHSSGLGPGQWRRALAAGAPPAREAVCLVGYDAPPEPTVPFDPARFRWRDDLDRVLAACTPETTVVGHSYGGFLAMQAARETAVAGLVIWEPVAWHVIGGELDHAPLPPPEDLECWLAGFIGFWNGPGAWEALSPAQQAPFIRYGRKVQAEVRALIDDRTPLSTWAEISCPTTFLSGAETLPAASSVCARLATALPHARHEVVDGVGHMGPLSRAGHEAIERALSRG